MGSASRKGLVAALRSRISDDRPSVSAFSLTLNKACKAAFLEVGNGFFRVTVEGGEGVSGVNLSLSLPTYNTTGRLVAALTRLPGYEVVPDETFQTEHPSVDLRTRDGGVKQLHGSQAETLRHYRFSDSELQDVVSEAISVHNPNYDINSVPDSEHPYVLMKAAARIYRILASDTAKRKGLDTEPATFLALAKDLEDQYSRDTKRQARILPSPRMDESKIHTGDIITGHMTRRSLRVGYNASYREATPPDPPTLHDPADDDVEDVVVRLRWTANRSLSYSYVELWRDAFPDVERSVEGRLVQQSAIPSPSLPITTRYSRAGTAKQILGLALGSNRVAPIFDGFFFWTATELAGSNVVNTTFLDGRIHPEYGMARDLSVLGEPLEPETEYFYRLYLVNFNGEIQHSNVIKVRTRSMRSLAKRESNNALSSDAVSPTSGPLAGGTAVTIKGTNFTSGTKVYLNGKPCTVQSVTSTQLVVLTPGLTNTDFINYALDLVIASPNGLKDIITRAFAYTA